MTNYFQSIMSSYNQAQTSRSISESELFKLEELAVYFNQESNIIEGILNTIRGDKSEVKAVDDVNITLRPNEVQGVIGESGCGKSTLLKTMVGLQDLTAGKMFFEGQPISKFNKEDLHAFRRDVQMIFQDPFNSLDPKYTISDMLSEQLQIHELENTTARKREILRQVELNPPESYLNKYPDELSGGEKQRASIARALIVDPKVLLADEPVSMLDVSTQASILRLLSEIVSNNDMGMMYISHDISTVSYVCDYINVMYLGRLIEKAPTESVLQDPKHPYTQALVQAVPVPDPQNERARISIDGKIPDPLNVPTGCRFKDRCPEQMEICDQMPKSRSIESNERRVACHLYD